MTSALWESVICFQALPDIYFITDHYRGWAAVLARLAKLRVPECRRRLEQGWRLKAPPKLVKQLDEAQGKPPPLRRKARTKSATS